MAVILFLQLLMPFLFIVFLAYKYNVLNLDYALVYYLGLFFIFYIFRGSILILGYDSIFPEMIVYRIFESSDYFLFNNLIFLWLLVFLGVYLLCRNRVFPTKFIPSISNNQSKLSLGHTHFFAFTISVISLVIFLDIYLKFKSIEGMMYYVRISEDFHLSKFIKLLPILALFISYLFLAKLIILKKQISNTKLIIWGSLAIFYVALNAFITIAFGDRSPIVLSSVAFILVLLIFSDKNPRKIVSSIFIVVVALGSALLLKSLRNVELGIESYDTGLLRDIASGLNLNIVDGLLSSISGLGDAFGLRYGYDFYLSIIGVVPRVLWDGKPEVINTGVWFASLFSNRIMGVPISPIGEWFINFHVIGVVVGGAISAYILLKFELNLLLNSKNIDNVFFFFIYFFQVFNLGFDNQTIRNLIFVLFIHFLYKIILHVNLGRKNESFS